MNDRRYCLAWLRSNKEFTLVQDSFKFIQVRSLEEKCRKEDVLPRIDMPSEKQCEYINLLDECVKKIFAGFIETESLPECVAVNKNSSKKGKKIPHLRVKKIYTGLVVANPFNFSCRCFIL